MFEESSPRPWGCFRTRQQIEKEKAVFPTPVGVFLVLGNLVGLIDSLPHARGGVSEFTARPNPDGLSSPRPWGCF